MSTAVCVHSTGVLTLKRVRINALWKGFAGKLLLRTDLTRDPHNRVTASSKRRARLASSQQTVIPASSGAAAPNGCMTVAVPVPIPIPIPIPIPDPKPIVQKSENRFVGPADDSLATKNTIGCLSGCVSCISAPQVDVGVDVCGARALSKAFSGGSSTPMAGNKSTSMHFNSVNNFI